MCLRAAFLISIFPVSYKMYLSKHGLIYKVFITQNEKGFLISICYEIDVSKMKGKQASLIYLLYETTTNAMN